MIAFFLKMGYFIVAIFLLTSVSRSSSVIAELLVANECNIPVTVVKTAEVQAPLSVM